MRCRTFWVSCVASLLLAGHGSALAQDKPEAQPKVAESRCLALASTVAPGPRLVRVASQAQGLTPDQVRLTFVGHATFLIESESGVKIATDYNDYVRPDVIPDIATMNRAHTTHYSNYPDPAITYVLRGWNPAGGPANHDVTYKDVRVRNVPTNIRGYDGGEGPQTNLGAAGNSIFVFELAGLCIAHLEHLHHTLSPAQLGALGQLDVVLVPVDGSWTLDLDGMIEVLKAIHAPLIIPMHYFSPMTLERFLSRIEGVFEVKKSDSATVVISRASLAHEPTVLVLPGR